MAKKERVEMTNELLAGIFRRSGDALVEMGAEVEDELLKAIAANAEEAMNHEKKELVMTLSHSIRIDLGKSEQKDTLGWRVSCKTEMSSRLDDPDQGQMDLER